MGILIFLIIAGIIGGILAKNKNRSVGGWGIGCFLMPLFILILLVLKPLSGEKRNCPACGKENPIEFKKCQVCLKDLPKIETPVEATKKCPFCAELIKAEASVCKHCGKDQPETQTFKPYEPYEFK